MLEQGKQDRKSFHLAGIVPVAGQELDFKFPWHDSMMPLAPDYLAVEAAVHECAMAGCETIWLVCHKEMQPLIRYRLGDWVIDPITHASLKIRFNPRARDSEREIPIYYVPIHPKDRDKRDCLSWSALFGATRAYHVSKLISKWVVPDRYYVSFPYGLYNPEIVRKNRTLISSKKRFFLSQNGKTVADGEYLGFTMDGNDFAMYRKNLRDQGTGVWKTSFWDEEARTIKGEKYDVGERYSARHFELDTVFGCAKLDEAEILETDWYFNISDWDGYRRFIGSEECAQIKRPYNMKYHEWNNIGEDNEKEE